MKMSEYLNDKDNRYIDIVIEDNFIDEKRFIDPYTLIHLRTSAEGGRYKDKVLNKISTFFEKLLSYIKQTNADIMSNELIKTSNYIHEAKYTKLGYSQGGYGKAFGGEKFELLVKSIKNSNAFNTDRINDIIDAEIYVIGVGVDLVSDLVSNLIYDILSEYTFEKVNELNKGDTLDEVDINYWDEKKKGWSKKKAPCILYYDSDKLVRYLLVPYSFTCDSKGKETILSKIFDESIYDIVKEEIMSDREKNEKYIKKYEDSRIKVFKKSAVKKLNNDFSEGTATENGTRPTSKGLLDLIEVYPEIKNYIKEEIKKGNI